MCEFTDRDRHLIAKALAYAVEVMPMLSREQRSASDRTGMKRLLGELVPSDRDLAEIIRSARWGLFEQVLPMPDESV